MPVAELAGDADEPLLGEDALDLGAPDHPERVGDALLGTAAREGAGRALNSADVVIGEMRLKQLRCGASREECRRRERLDARRRARPGNVIRRGGSGETLEQQSPSPRAVGGDRHPAVDLLGRSQVVLEQRRDRRRLERDDALIERSAVLRVERDHEPGRGRIRRPAPRATPRPDSCRGHLLPLCGRAQGERCVALDDEQADRTVALQLDDQRALELERRGEQRGGGEQLGQHVPQWRRIGMTVEDLAARAVEAHERAAHRGVLEHEASERV